MKNMHLYWGGIRESNFTIYECDNFFFRHDIFVSIIYTCVRIYVCIYIYIEREREKENDWQTWNTSSPPSKYGLSPSCSSPFTLDDESVEQASRSTGNPSAPSRIVLRKMGRLRLILLDRIGGDDSTGSPEVWAS